MRNEEVNALRGTVKDKCAFDQAVRLTDDLVLGEEFLEFLTLPAYKLILKREERSRL